jgi:hypothetical protein
MAYGDNRSAPVASDTFDTTIDGNWTNGEGGWDPFTADGSGLISPDAANNRCILRRNSAAFDDDQYAQTTIFSSDEGVEPGAIVRAQTTGDLNLYQGKGFTENAPVGAARIFTGIYLVNDTGIGEIAISEDTIEEDPYVAGDTITLEVEGTALRLGINVATDVEVSSGTDGALSDGEPGIYALTESNTLEVTSWIAGNIGVLTGIDTREKRAAVLGVARPWMRSKFPQASKDQEWRMASGNTYGGNALSPGPAGVNRLLLINPPGLDGGFGTGFSL